MVSAHDVAALIFEEQDVHGRTVDKMQLQKLLYIVQGAHLEFWGEPAFREDVRAYRNGPVVEAVESTYRTASEGTDPLPGALGGNLEALDADRVDTVRTVLGYFGLWPASGLERYVKRGPDNPWVLARDRAGVSLDDMHARPRMESADIGAWFHKRGIDPNQPRPRSFTPSEEQLIELDHRIEATRAASNTDLDDLRPYVERALAVHDSQ
jgi:uncharacterized phage-associated protein